MNVNIHNDLAGKIWEIADHLRGPYRPPQYRHVMLPLIVLRRFDCVLEPTKKEVLDEYGCLDPAKTPRNAIEKKLTDIAEVGRNQPLYNISKYTFRILLDDQENIAPNLIDYINGFSQNACEIFEKFNFTDQIEKLDASNRLYTVVKAVANIDMSPKTVDNLQMGYVFEELVRRFNEQANEEAGDHFTPREVIRLMANLIYTGEEAVYTSDIYRTIYDPACGTGGMLSVSEEHIKRENDRANLDLFGQEYNDESWAICCSDMLIKDEPVDQIKLADTLGDGKTGDEHQDKKFHYMLANPPFGVQWENQKIVVEKEHKDLGFAGRFGAGLPSIGDGSLLFLQHMLSKRHPAPEESGEGSRIAIVFNGSPLFSGDAGSGPSNIRRWIIENDWLDAIVALPDQLFYNTGISTYIWLVTNRKTEARKGKVQLIDGTRFCERMKKSLGNKRYEISDDQIAALTRIYGNYQDGEAEEERVVSRIFPNSAFGYLKITVDRPLRMNFQASPERIVRLDSEKAFVNLAVSKKSKNAETVKAEEEAGQKQQAAIKAALGSMDAEHLYKDRAAFEADLDGAAKTQGVKFSAAVKKAVFAAVGERDPSAEPCLDSQGHREPDSELRDTENIPLREDAPQLPSLETSRDEALTMALNEMFNGDIDAHMKAEVLPHVPDAWVDWDKTKIGYEIPLNRHFYVHKPPRPLKEIEADIQGLEREIAELLKDLAT